MNYVCISVHESNLLSSQADRDEAKRKMGDLVIAHCDKLYSLAHCAIGRNGRRYEHVLEGMQRRETGRE